MDSFGVIFDVDGVLVDSYQLHFDSWRVSAKRDSPRPPARLFAAFARMEMISGTGGPYL